MIVQLESVVFDQGAGAAGGGLSIRQDRTTAAPVWTPATPDPSPGVYTLSQAAAQTLTIQATFSFPDLAGLAGPSVSVRAIAEDPDSSPLGDIEATPVPVPPPSLIAPTSTVVMQLPHATISDAGVGTYPQAWLWQFQPAPGAAWVPMAASKHVIYVTLDSPGVPWSQGPGAADVLRWPWTRVLDWSCAWAEGINILDGDLDAAIRKAAQAIEEQIYALGDRANDTLEYADDGSGGSYVVEYPEEVAFRCTNFLRLLDGDPTPPISPKVNCSDCASALLAFANILGADLSSRRLVHGGRRSTFHTNQILVIGDHRANAHDFDFHEVAGRGQTAPRYHVFDGCLLIDRDDDPTGVGNHDFGLSQGLGLFSGATDPKVLKYVHRLVVSDDWEDLQDAVVPVRCLDECDGVPAQLNLVTKALHDEYLKKIEDIATSTDDTVAPLDTNPIRLPGFAPYHTDLETPQLAPLKKLIRQAADFYYGAAPDKKRKPVRQRGIADTRLRLSMAASATPAQARDALAWVLAQSSTPLSMAKSDGKSAIGDACFSGPRQASVYFVRGNTIARLTNVGRQRTPLMTPAATVDVALVNRLKKRSGPLPPAGRTPRY